MAGHSDYRAELSGMAVDENAYSYRGNPLQKFAAQGRE
jgi:hypothetical protein